MIGHDGFARIEKELKAFYNDPKMPCEIINTENGDQFCFLRAFISKKSGMIKVEILQNMAAMYPTEVPWRHTNFFQKRILVCLKLMSAANRKSAKDIYDLDFITEKISITDLLADLQAKHTKYCEHEHKCLFDLG